MTHVHPLFSFFKITPLGMWSPKQTSGWDQRELGHQHVASWKCFWDAIIPMPPGGARTAQKRTAVPSLVFSDDLCQVETLKIDRTWLFKMPRPSVHHSIDHKVKCVTSLLYWKSLSWLIRILGHFISEAEAAGWEACHLAKSDRRKDCALFSLWV